MPSFLFLGGILCQILLSQMAIPGVHSATRTSYSSSRYTPSYNRRQGTSVSKPSSSVSSSNEKQNNLLNLLGFNRWESMIHRVLSYDQLDCVPRMICEAVVDRNTSTPLFSNLASQLPQVFGSQPTAGQQTLIDPFNGLTTGAGQSLPAASAGLPNAQGQTNIQPQTEIPSSPQGFLSTFLSQIGIGNPTQAPVFQQPAFQNARPQQYPQSVQQVPSASSNVYNVQLPPGGALASLLQSQQNNALLTNQLQQVNNLQQQYLDSFQGFTRPQSSGTVSFRDLKKRAVINENDLLNLFLEGVGNEVRRSKRQIAIQTGSMEQLFKRIVGEETTSFKLADAAYQGTKMERSKECREHYKECPTDALGWIEAMAKLPLPSINFG